MNKKEENNYEDNCSYEIPLFPDDYENNIIRRRCLYKMPFDKHGNHATGYEVLFKDDDIWWLEYEDSETGEYFYGN